MERPSSVYRISFEFPNIRQFLEPKKVCHTFYKHVSLKLNHREVKTAQFGLMFVTTLMEKKIARLTAIVEEDWLKEDGTMVVRVLLGIRDRQKLLLLLFPCPKCSVSDPDPHWINIRWPTGSGSGSRRVERS
jgi:hypothetical protein